MAAQYSSAAASPAVVLTPKQLRQQEYNQQQQHQHQQQQQNKEHKQQSSTSSSAPPVSAATAAIDASNDGSGENGQPGHKRVYQACIPCRRRKVRCDLGSVDNPHDPPCVRCRRESKECFFSATRRKRKTEDDGSDLEEYVIRNGRRKLQAGGTESPMPRPDRRSSYLEAPATPGSNGWRSQPLRRPDGSGRKRHNEFGEGDADQTLENLEAQNVMRQQMYGPHDALDLLYKAATDRYVVSGLLPLLSLSLSVPISV